MTALAFDAPALASQAVFRTVMNAFARPGEIGTVNANDSPAGLCPATASLLLALCDYETPVWIDLIGLSAEKASAWIRFATGAPLVADPADATFAVMSQGKNLGDWSRFSAGTEDYPDRSATLIIEIEAFAGAPLVLAGPGINGTRKLPVLGLPDDFAAQFNANHELFPRGVDIVLTCGNQLAALPRSQRILEVG